MSKVVSANDLVTGAVVFLRDDGTWGAFDEAAPFANGAEAEAALAVAKRSAVVDAFVHDRKDDVAGPAAMTLRNAIRAYGPTIDYMPASSRPAS